MSNKRGHIWIEPCERPRYEWKESDNLPISTTQGKNFCPSCGSSDLDLKGIIVFGNPGYIVKAHCRNCGRNF